MSLTLVSDGLLNGSSLSIATRGFLGGGIITPPIVASGGGGSVYTPGVPSRGFRDLNTDVRDLQLDIIHDDDIVLMKMIQAFLKEQ